MRRLNRLRPVRKAVGRTAGDKISASVSTQPNKPWPSHTACPAATRPL